MSLAGDLRKLGSRTPLQRTLLIEALFWVSLMSAVLKICPIRVIAKLFGFYCLDKPASTTATDADITSVPDQTDSLAWAIGSALSAAGSRLRGSAGDNSVRGACLAQGLAGLAMLRRRQVPVQLVLGIASDKSAHAWLQYQGTVINGANGHKRFTPAAVLTWKNTN